jgi:hypothetical protein
MASDITITVSTRWQEETPDDLPVCQHCGDLCFRVGHRLAIRIGQDSDWLPQELWVCDSCYDPEMG